MSLNVALKVQDVQVSMKELIEAGCHFGHPKSKWNPKMKPYIHHDRNGVYVINLQETAFRFREALDAIKGIASTGQKVLFVGTKRQAQEVMVEQAKRVGQPYVAERWIGGCLTNFNTIKRSVTTMKQLGKMAEEKNYGRRKKKEILNLQRQQEKLERYYFGIKDMVDLPGAIFVVDPKREYISISEAQTLGIPIFAIVDTNCDPDGIDYVIPGNDDSIRAISLYATKVADAILEGQKTRESHLQRLGQKSDAQSDEAKASKSTSGVKEVVIEARKESKDSSDN